MNAKGSYSTPASFRRALTDRLTTKAKEGRWSLAQLERQFAYDRLLQRIYQLDRNWIIKGATALIAREIGVRGTIDIDVYRPKPLDVAEAELRHCSSRDLGDWFRFEIGPHRVASDGARGIRLPVTAHVATAVWVRFHVDLFGNELRITGEPDDVSPMADIHMAEIEQLGYRVYPLADHIADKIVAIFQRYGDGQVPSTRFKDLVDLVAIVTTSVAIADAQKVAIASETARRGLELPNRFAVPDRFLWEPGYAAEARRSHLQNAKYLDEAIEIVRPFVDRLLDGSASGRWDPTSRKWR